MIRVIVATSGFILPENIYYEPFEVKDEAIDRIFNRSIAPINNKELVEFYSDKNVYKSQVIENAIIQYLGTKDFESFMKLVDISIEILSRVGFLDFFRLQTANKYLSNLSFNFCLDCVNGNLIRNKNNYNLIPFNIRFSMSNQLTESDVLIRTKAIEREFKESNFARNWPEFISRLMEDRDAFFVFFKYIFADYY